MTRLSVPSFAKINWILKILGKRKDHYHQIRTIYQTIDLSEEIVFEPTRNPAIELEIEGRKVARREENLVHRAADLLRTTVGLEAGVKIRLHKMIPVGAGLGGGASNAAVTLSALNQLWQCKLSAERLAELGTQLGSDIPFFLLGGTAVGWGRGEEVVPLPDVLRKQTLLLLYPDLVLSTKEAYTLGKWGTYDGPDVLTSTTLDTTMRRLLRATDPKEDGWSFLENDFEDVLFAHYPVLVKAKAALEQAGCERVMLCGSGSTLLGFGSINQVKEAAVTLSQKKMGEVFICRTLSRKQYRQFLTSSGLILP